MARRSRPKERTVHQLLVTLRGSNPLIWRRIAVHSDVNLEYLHAILQIAMGWEDYHLHEFEANGIAYVMVDPEGDGVGREIDPTEWSYGRPARYADEVRLGRIAPSPGGHLVYTYDFGDDWKHDIVVEDVEPAERDVHYPICLGGGRRCPREDAGGISGYEEMLEILRDPDHEEYEATLTWLGENFDPDDFDIEATNRALRSVKPPKVLRR